MAGLDNLGGDAKTMATGLVEPGPRKAEVVTGGSGGVDLPVGKKNIWCNGCWEVLPEYCGCGSLRACSFCAAGVLVDSLAEPGPREADVGESSGFPEAGGEDGTGNGHAAAVTMDMIRLELQRTSSNLDRMQIIGGGMGEVMAELQNIRDSMVTRDDYDALLNRMRGLEADGSEYDSESEERTGYTDHGTDDEASDFDGDGFED